VQARLDPSEPLVDAAPARGDEVDQKGEIVHARVAVGEQVALHPLQASDHLVHQPANLCELTGDGERLRADALPDRTAYPLGERRLELRSRLRKRLDLAAGALERGFELSRLGAPLRRPVEPLLRPLESRLVHRGKATLATGRMRVSELDYDLPRELIAQHPAARRDESRLLVFDRATGAVRHRRFSELPQELPPDTLTVVNDTRVVPARIRLDRPKGEVLLLERIGEETWEALARPTRRLRAGRRYGPVELVEHLGEGRWLVRLAGEPDGEAPLPPYITEPLGDPERYQTVYARDPGSAAAPTAGLHFTAELLSRLDVERVTLHVGLDTFRPVTADDLEEHELHGERYAVAPAAWERIRSAERVLAVGTTTVRVLETVASNTVLQGRTRLFVTPGFEFRRVDHLLTNFHLPRSTLLALVMAFAGVEETRRLYRLAIAERYRFYSFGDAMLIL
jgi:S-adenosylmethionine:tRNA ribosyltransferase-isomerase